MVLQCKEAVLGGEEEGMQIVPHTGVVVLRE